MGKPTVTRATLMQAIGRAFSMEFFKRFSSSISCDSTSSGTFIIDSTLTQPDDWWKNMWFYVTSDSTSSGNEGAVRLIDHFSAAENKLFLEHSLPASASAATSYEIFNIFSPFEIQDAINEAIRSGFPNFFDIVTDETLVYEEDKLSYSLGSLTDSPWIISSVWIEQPSSSILGVVDSATANSFTDASADMSEVTSSWMVSIYSGTGSGQVRYVSSVTGHTPSISVAWTVNPDSTSKYRLWDASEENYDWYRVAAWRSDQDEFPNYLYFPQTYGSAYGCRIRLVYASQPPELTLDTSTTVVPKEYVIAKAIEILAASKVASNSADRSKYAGMEQIYGNRAEQYKMTNSFRMTTDMSMEADPSSPSAIGEENPLNW